MILIEIVDGPRVLRVVENVAFLKGNDANPYYLDDNRKPGLRPFVTLEGAKRAIDRILDVGREGVSVVFSIDFPARLTMVKTENARRAFEADPDLVAL